jgi:lysophospholipase L1-like esterase
MPTLSRLPTKDKKEIMTYKIVALGDSLVYGYGDPVGGGSAKRLRRLWMESAGHVPV